MLAATDANGRQRSPNGDACGRSTDALDRCLARLGINYISHYLLICTRYNHLRPRFTSLRKQTSHRPSCPLIVSLQPSSVDSLGHKLPTGSHRAAESSPSSDTEAMISSHVQDDAAVYLTAELPAFLPSDRRPTTIGGQLRL